MKDIAIFDSAKQIHEEMVAIRRQLHGIGGVQFDVEATTQYLLDKLREYGYEPRVCGKAGVVATVGNPGKTFLLRADMDGLPMKEDTGLPFASQSGCCHACGHDMHMTMLLGAAKLLKERESELKGTVKLMFEPGEEVMLGANDMIQDGLLEGPKVDTGMALHVWVGDDEVKTGELKVIVPTVCRSGDVMTITVHGKAVHSSTPDRGVDANSIGCRIFNGLEEIIANEVPRECPTVITTGRMEGGTASNTVSDECKLVIGIRCGDPKVRLFVLQRMEEVAHYMALAYRAEATCVRGGGGPPIVNDKALCNELVGYIKDVLGEEHIHLSNESTGIGEDFGVIQEHIPAMYAFIGAGCPSEGYEGALHQPATRFNEDVLPYGAAIETYTAMKWLENNA